MIAAPINTAFIATATVPPNGGGGGGGGYVPPAPEIASVNAYTAAWNDGPMPFPGHACTVNWITTNEGHLPTTYTVGLEETATGETYVVSANCTAGPNNGMPGWDTEDFSIEFAPLQQWFSAPSQTIRAFVTLNSGPRVYAPQEVGWTMSGWLA